MRYLEIAVVDFHIVQGPEAHENLNENAPDFPLFEEHFLFLVFRDFLVEVPVVEDDLPKFESTIGVQREYGADRKERGPSGRKIQRLFDPGHSPSGKRKQASLEQDV